MTEKERQDTHIRSITTYESYGFWLECSCEYQANGALATFCGGCGHNIKLPDYVQEAFDIPGILSLYLKEDGQWYAQVWTNYVRHEIALRPELNGAYTI